MGRRWVSSAWVNSPEWDWVNEADDREDMTLGACRKGFRFVGWKTCYILERVFERGAKGVCVLVVLNNEDEI